MFIAYKICVCLLYKPSSRCWENACTVKSAIVRNRISFCQPLENCVQSWYLTARIQIFKCHCFLIANVCKAPPVLWMKGATFPQCQLIKKIVGSLWKISLSTAVYSIPWEEGSISYTLCFQRDAHFFTWSCDWWVELTFFPLHPPMG